MVMLPGFKNTAFISIVDQAMVSGCNFLTQILVARLLGLEGYGWFTILWMIPLLLSNIHNGLLLYPMMTIGAKQLPEEKNQYYSSIFFHQLIFCLLSFFVVYFVAIYILKTDEQAMWIATATVAFQFQDFVRRYLFSLQLSKQAFLSDLISYGGQLIVLSLYFASAHHHLQQILQIFSLTSCLATLVAVNHLKTIHLSIAETLSAFYKNFKSGKWLCLSSLIQWSGSQGILVIGGFYLGASSLGGARAIINTTSAVNIAVQGLQNSIPVRASQILTQEGYSRFYQYLHGWALRITGLFLIIAILTIVFRHELILLLYGNAFSDFSNYVVIQSIYAFLSGAILPFVIYFRTLEFTKPVTTSFAIAAFSAIVFSVVSFPMLKVSTFFYSLLINQVVIFSTLLFSFFKAHQENLSVQPSLSKIGCESHGA